VIDLHCHILPALDDGALDLDDAVGMARQPKPTGSASSARHRTSATTTTW
jgi:tyrosine-protein phosphatase YwqE